MNKGAAALIFRLAFGYSLRESIELADEVARMERATHNWLPLGGV